MTRPLPIKALLDAAAGDEAVAKALLAKKVPALEAARGSILLTFEARGFRVSSTARKQIAACDELARLQAWLRAVVTAPSVATALRASAS